MSNSTHLVICSCSLHLKLFGNHKRSVIGLEESLFVKARVESGHRGGHLVQANLDRLLATLFGSHLRHHGPRNAVVESQVHALCRGKKLGYSDRDVFWLIEAINSRL